MASITTAHPFLAKHKDKIHGVLSCFDRVIIRGHLPLSYPKGLEGFLYQQNVLLKNFKDYAPQIADRVRDHVKAVVQKADAPFRHLPSKEPFDGSGSPESDGIGPRRSPRGLSAGFRNWRRAGRSGSSTPGPDRGCVAISASARSCTCF